LFKYLKPNKLYIYHKFEKTRDFKMVKNVDQSLVTIKPLAYYKMLLHILRFGSKHLEQKKLSEVMGVLIGRLEGEDEIKNVIVEDVVPVSHGGSIEVKFSVDQLGAFGEIDGKIWEQYGDVGWFSVGWYHSHPGLGIFFSETDKFNQIFWQKNPSGIGIVFDHTYLDKPGDNGFRVFRLDETNLDDPSLALKSGYHEVNAKVDPPNDLEYYLKIMELINKIHTGTPQILELNETLDLFSDVDIPEEDQLISKLPEIDFNEVFTALQKGMGGFLEHTLKPIIYFMNSWGQDTTNRINLNNSLIRNDLKDLRDKLSSEIINLQQSFNYNLQNDLRDLDFYVDDKLEEFDNEKDNILSVLRNSSGESRSEIANLFAEKGKSMFDPVLNNISSISSSLSEFNQKFSNLIRNLEQGRSSLSDLTERHKSLDKFIQSSINTVQEDIITTYANSTHKMKTTINNLNKETKGYLSNLKAAIILLESLKTPIKEKLNSMQTENKELQKTVKDLRSENKNLLNKIKKLERGGE
jgi:proteasome lid subunit RPN8/RPN11